MMNTMHAQRNDLTLGRAVWTQSHCCLCSTNKLADRTASRPEFVSEQPSKIHAIATGPKSASKNTLQVSMSTMVKIQYVRRTPIPAQFSCPGVEWNEQCVAMGLGREAGRWSRDEQPLPSFATPTSQNKRSHRCIEHYDLTTWRNLSQF